MDTNESLRRAKERSIERALLGTALAALAGYLVLAWTILREGTAKTNNTAPADRGCVRRNTMGR